MNTRFLVLTVLLITIISCSFEEDTADPVFCTEDARPALEIIVVSTTTGAIITDNVEVVAIDGDYKETLSNYQNSSTFLGAFERDGVYTIYISKDGYLDYTSVNPIIVERDICHVITQKRTIQLQSSKDTAKKR